MISDWVVIKFESISEERLLSFFFLSFISEYHKSLMTLRRARNHLGALLYFDFVRIAVDSNRRGYECRASFYKHHLQRCW